MITQHQAQKQQLKILPQQIQLLNLYFLSHQELEQRIKNELEENPLLEMKEEEHASEDENRADSVQDYQDWDEFKYDDVPDYRHEYQNYLDSDLTPDRPLVSRVYYKEEAIQQLQLLDLSDGDLELGTYLIEMLNGNGILDKPLDEIADDLSFSLQRFVNESDLERVLEIIQTLDPIGIGARSVQECLLIQLKDKKQKNPEVRCAVKLIGKHYNDLMHRQFEKIMSALGIDEDELRIVLNFIGTLKFHPVAEEASQLEPKNTIIPDFVITNNGEATHVSLYSSRSNSVYVNQILFDQLSQQCSRNDKTATQYIRGKLQSAQWFVTAVKQREETMMRIMQCIVKHQEEYFAEGDIRLLKPMVLRNISDKTGLDISTISRITSNKYAETHFGLVYLKNLFSEGIADKNGEVISNKVIQSVIEEAIMSEDKRNPYTDQQLVHILTSKGYNIARRTVAKYREQLKIPIAQIRAVRA